MSKSIKIGAIDGPDKDYKEHMSIDVTDKAIKNFKLGDTITMTVEGTIGRLDMRDDMDWPASVGITVESKTVKTLSNDEKDIDDLMDDEE